MVTFDLPHGCCKMMKRSLLRFRSSSLLLLPSIVRRTFCATSASSTSTSSSAAPPGQQQFPETDKKRILELADIFEASKNQTSGFLSGMNRFRKWVEDNNKPASQKTVQFLLPICLRTGKKSDTEIVMDYINRRGWKSDEEGLRNVFLVSMAKSGQYDKALKIYRAIEDSGEKLRLTGVFALLEAATNERDFPTMLSLSRHLREKAKGMAEYSSLHADVALSIEHVLLAVKGVEDAVAMEVTFELLDTVRLIRRKLGEEMADVIKEWVNSSEWISLAGETIVNYSGKCSGCGLKLHRGDITPKELEVLRQHIDTVFEKIFAEQSRNIQQDRYRLNQLRKMVEDTDFGVVMDGMNISHRGPYRTGFDRRVLFQVASEAVDKTGKPVLVILRKFSEKLIAPQHLDGRTNSDVFDLHRSQGIHFYFTYNWDEDDLYTAYAAMHSKPSTYLLTNDYQSCVRRHLSDNMVRVIFEQWLRVRRAHSMYFRRNRQCKIQFPLEYDDVLQWSPPENGPSWQNLHIPLGFRRRWLCIQQRQSNNSTAQNNTTQEIIRH